MGRKTDQGHIHIPIIYGYYFFTEAILKIQGEKFLPWGERAIDRRKNGGDSIEVANDNILLKVPEIFSE